MNCQLKQSRLCSYKASCKALELVDMNDMSVGTAHPLTEKYHLFIASKDLALSVYLIYQGKFMK